MVTVQFFSNPKMDNNTRISNFSDLSAQNSYFTNLSKLAIAGVRISPVGEPFVVEVPWTQLMGYSYGRFQAGSKWWYFSIADIEPVNDTKTRVIYSIDAWETCRHQYGVALGRGVISRSGRQTGMEIPRPLDPVYTRTKAIQNLGVSAQIVALAYVHDSAADTDYLYQALMTSEEDRGLLLDGSWLSQIGVNNINDVIGAWISPWAIPANVGPWEDTTPAALYSKRIKMSEYNQASSQVSLTLSAAPKGDQSVIYGITDMRGNVAWSCDLSSDMEPSIVGFLDISPSSAVWRMRVSPSENAEGRFTIPCEAVYYWSDTFTDYVSRQRAYDQQMRSLNNDKQLVGSITGIASNAIGGAVAGTAAGPAGTVAGAVLGTVGGIIGSAATYLTAPAFDSKEQQITDDYYRKQADSLAFMGDGLWTIVHDPALSTVQLVTISTDAATVEAYQGAIDTGGYYYPNVEASDMEEWVVDGPLMADVEVLGPVPDAWKEQIRNRIRNGVIFI